MILDEELGHKTNSPTRSQGLVKQGLGSDNWQQIMKDFYTEHMGAAGCEDRECLNSDLKNQVDTEQWLKNFAW